MVTLEEISDRTKTTDRERALLGEISATSNQIIGHVLKYLFPAMKRQHRKEWYLEMMRALSHRSIVSSSLTLTLTALSTNHIH